MLSLGEYGKSENEQGILSFLFILIKLVFPEYVTGHYVVTVDYVAFI